MITRLETYGAWLGSDPAGFAVYMAYLGVTILLSLILISAFICNSPSCHFIKFIAFIPPSIKN